MTALSLLLVIASDHLLKIEGPMWWISVLTSTLITLTVVAMALGFGSVYADFKAENRAAALGGLGAVLFLLTAMAFEIAIIVLGASPAYRLVVHRIRDAALSHRDLLVLALWIITSLGASLAAGYFSLKKGIEALEKG